MELPGTRHKPIVKSFRRLLNAVAGSDLTMVERLGGRYTQVEKSSLGETSGASGGYIVPVEYSTKLLIPLVERSLIYPRALVIPMAATEIRAPMLNATSSQASGTAPFFGGLLFKWGMDGSMTITNNQSEPTFREQTLRAWDLTGYGVMSNQWLDDSGPDGDARLIDLLGKAAAWYAEYAFFNGLGTSASMPLGILNAPCRYEVTRAGAGAISHVDIANMASRLLPMSWASAIWVCSPPALAKIEQVTGYTPNMARNGEFDSCCGYLSNHPLYVSDKLPALGSTGDLVLIDPSLYVIGDRAEVIVDISKEVPNYFQKNQAVYRVWLRLDGKPVLNGKVTLPQSSQEVSSIVVLA